MFKEGKMFITRAKKHKKALQSDRAEKDVNYKRKAKMLLWFRLKLTERDKLRTAENRFQCEKG